MNAGPPSSARSDRSDSDGDLRCAEYVLGVLDAAERRELEEEIRLDAEMAQSLARWQQRLLPLSEDVEAGSPPAYVWTRIRSELGFLRSPQAHGEQGGIWNNLSLWRWLGIGATAAALAFGTMSLFMLYGHAPPRAVTQVVGTDYRVASIARPDGTVDWTATIDLRRGSLIIVPVNAVAPPDGRATQLWLIPPGANPISLGVVATNGPATISLAQTVIARMATGAVMAVSLEPSGGSPTGQPTGPVLATGPVRGT